MTIARTPPPPFITGWCNEQPGHPAPLHHLCHHTYTTGTEKTYVCVCECHQERPVKKVERRADTNGARPVRYIRRRPAR
jgi:hypothetical protein